MATNFSDRCPIFNTGVEKELTLPPINTSLSISTKSNIYRFRRTVDVIGATAYRTATALVAGVSSRMVSDGSISSVLGIYAGSLSHIIGSISVMKSLDFFTNYASGDVVSTTITADMPLYVATKAKGTHNSSLGYMTVILRYRDA